ncbi:MAG: hypothetical protein LBV38_05150 [Alistipes sp.]|jgi:hypothetical protein|nr:hypothetical protein [Alistipes sp.]
MKNFVFLLSAFFMLLPYCGYAQYGPKFEGSKEEAIAILRNNEFLDILRYPKDSLGNVERFINELSKIAPIEPQNSELLKRQLLSVIKKKEGYWTDWSLVCWPIGKLPFIGSGADKVLKDNFSVAEYEIMSEQLLANMITATATYAYLTELHMVMEEWVVRGFIDGSDYIEMIYDYFDI